MEQYNKLQLFICCSYNLVVFDKSFQFTPFLNPGWLSKRKKKVRQTNKLKPDNIVSPLGYEVLNLKRNPHKSLTLSILSRGDQSLLDIFLLPGLNG